MHEGLHLVALVLGKRPLNALSYSDTRFTSSAYQSISRVMDCFQLFCTTIVEMGGVAIDTEKSYVIRGQDFVFDLCAVRDILHDCCCADGASAGLATALLEDCGLATEGS